MGRSLRIVITEDDGLDPIAPSLNTYMGTQRAGSYGRVHSDKVEWKERVQKIIQRELPPIPDEWWPLDVEVQCYFGPGETRYDAVNLVPTWKMIEDALQGAADDEITVLPNDNPTYINPITFAALKGGQRKTVVILSPGTLPRNGKLKRS